MNPKPKKKRIKLSKDAYVKLKTELWERQYRRCNRCQKYLTPEYCQFNHIKTRGAGGDDSEENGEIICWKCHHKIGTGELPKEPYEITISIRQ